MRSNVCISRTWVIFVTFHIYRQSYTGVYCFIRGYICGTYTELKICKMWLCFRVIEHYICIYLKTTNVVIYDSQTKQHDIKQISIYIYTYLLLKEMLAVLFWH